MTDAVSSGNVSPAVRLEQTFRFATALLLLLVLGASAYRAATQSMTHDEASTYDYYVAGPWSSIATNYAPNNHVLFSILAKISVGLFGATELSLRLPTLIAAAAFLFLIFLIGERCWRSGALRLVGTAVLVINPFIGDYLSAARGYGLMLAMLALSVYAALPDASGSHRPRASLCTAGIAGGLAVAANLSALFPVAALGVVLLLLRSLQATSPRRSVGRSVVQVLTLYAVPALLLGGGVTLIGMMNGAGLEQFVYASPTLAEMRFTLEQRFMNHSIPFEIAAGGGWIETPSMDRGTAVASTLITPLLGVVVIASVGYVSWKVIRGTSLQTLGGPSAMTMIAGWTSAIAIGLLVLADRLAGIGYPRGRTAIWLIVLVLMAAVSALAQPSRDSKAAMAAGGTGVVLLAALALYLLTQFQVSHYTDWEYDRHSREVFEQLEALRETDGSPPLRVLSVPFLYEPSLNFYRSIRKSAWLARVESDLTPESSFDYVVVHPALGDSEVIQERLAVIARHEQSGILIMAPKVR